MCRSFEDIVANLIAPCEIALWRGAILTVTATSIH